MRLQCIDHGHGTLTFKPYRSTCETASTTIRACLPKQDLKGQSVAVIGLGKSGIAAARPALARGASVLAIDQNDNLDTLEQNPAFEKHNSVKTILGHFDNNMLKDADTVVVSPGVPLENHGFSSLLQSFFPDAPRF